MEKKTKKKPGRPAKVKKPVVKEIKVKAVEVKEEKEIQCCGTCQHGFQSVIETKVVCKRFPPTPMSGGSYIFPVIEKTNICGEWRSKE